MLKFFFFIYNCYLVYDFLHPPPPLPRIEISFPLVSLRDEAHHVLHYAVSPTYSAHFFSFNELFFFLNDRWSFLIPFILLCCKCFHLKLDKWGVHIISSCFFLNKYFFYTGHERGPRIPARLDSYHFKLDIADTL